MWPYAHCLQRSLSQPKPHKTTDFNQFVDVLILLSLNLDYGHLFFADNHHSRCANRLMATHVTRKSCRRANTDVV